MADAAQQEFLQHFLPARDQIYALVWTLVRDRDLVEEIFQEVSVVLWEKFATFERGTSFTAWARQIAIFKIQNERRRSARQAVVCSPEALDAVVQSFEEIERLGNDDAWHRQLELCLGKLGPAGRQLIELRYFKGMKLKDIADVLQRTVAGVNSTLCKVRDALEKCLRLGMKEQPRANS